MKSGVYNVYVLLAIEGEVCSIKKARCECAAGYVLTILNLIAENLQAVHMFLVYSML